MNSVKKLKQKFIKFIASIIIIMIVFAIVENALSLNVVSAADGADIADGIAGVVLFPAKFIPLIGGKIMSQIMGLFADQGKTLTLGDIIFNKIEITKIDFFDFNTTSEAAKEIRMGVATWYYAFRNISAVILLVVLFYTGIRLATATVAEKKAKYSEMLLNWLISIALLFVLHYLIQFIITINNQLVDLLSAPYKQSDLSEPMDLMFNQSLKSIGFTKEMGSAICYVVLVGMTFVFLLSYLKRMVTIAFLIVIAPLVTITYSVDKMNDGKSQALNIWFKEFAYNVLIQPFHCLVYLFLVETGLTILQNSKSMSAILVTVFMVYFMYSSEKIIKHIFHFESRTMSDSVGHAAFVATALGTFNGIGARRGNRYSGLEDPNEEENKFEQTVKQPIQGSASSLDNNGQAGNQEENTKSEFKGNIPNDAMNNTSANERTSQLNPHKKNSRGSRVGRTLAAIARNPAVSTYFTVNKTIGNMMLSGGLSVAAGNRSTIIASQLQSIANGADEGKENSVIRNQYYLQRDYDSLAQEKERELIDERVKEETEKLDMTKLTYEEIKIQNYEIRKRIIRDEGKGIKKKSHNFATGRMESLANGEKGKNDNEKKISKDIKRLRVSYANKGMKEEKINEQITKDFGKVKKGEYKEGSKIEKNVKDTVEGAKDVANIFVSPVKDVKKFYKKKE